MKSKKKIYVRQLINYLYLPLMTVFVERDVKIRVWQIYFSWHYLRVENIFIKTKDGQSWKNRIYFYVYWMK